MACGTSNVSIALCAFYLHLIFWCAGFISVYGTSAVHIYKYLWTCCWSLFTLYICRSQKCHCSQYGLSLGMWWSRGMV